MKLVIKYGGTSISSAKDITAIAKYLNSLSTKNQIVVVCSAMSGTTDDLIEISESIKKENKLKGEQLASKIINRHKQLAKQTIKKSNTYFLCSFIYNHSFPCISCSTTRGISY